MIRHAGRILAALILLLTIAVPGAAGAIDFQRSSLEGQVLSLSQFRGRVVVLDFFATWCGPCTQAMPKLRQLQAAYGHAGVSVIGYSVDREGATVVGPYAARHGLNFPVVLGDAAEAKRIADVDALPTTLVISPQGNVVARFKGTVSQSTLLAAVRPYLPQNVAPAPTTEQSSYENGPTGRFSRVWVTPNMIFQGHTGVFVHAIVNVADLNPYQGLWLGLRMQPARLDGFGRAVPLGKGTSLYQLVEDAWRSHFILFLRCEQLPALPGGGSYQAYIDLLGPGQKVLARSEDFWMADDCDRGVQAAPEKKQYEQADAKLRGEKRDRRTGMLEKMRWSGEGRMRNVWLTGPAMHENRPGYFVHIEADMEGLNLTDGVWFCLNFGPASPDGKGGYPPTRLTHRVDTGYPGYYVLFVDCDQLPPQAKAGGSGMFITLLAGPKRMSLERTGIFQLEDPCNRATAQAAPAGNTE